VLTFAEAPLMFGYLGRQSLQVWASRGRASRRVREGRTYEETDGYLMISTTLAHSLLVLPAVTTTYLVAWLRRATQPFRGSASYACRTCQYIELFRGARLARFSAPPASVASFGGVQIRYIQGRQAYKDKRTKTPQPNPVGFHCGAEGFCMCGDAYSSMVIGSSR